MTMHANIELAGDGTMVDLYAETGVVRGNEIRWQNLSNTMVYSYVDDTAPVDRRTAFSHLPPNEKHIAEGSQYVYVWSDAPAEIHVESV